MKALGMIEVYGYLAAVEALDAALKAANVRLIRVDRVKGGLVSVLVTGDVGATKAAIDAGAAAAERVGQVVSVHVIPRPAADVQRMLGDGPGAPPPAPAPDPDTEPTHIPPAEEVPEKPPVPAPAPQAVEEAPVDAADMEALEEETETVDLSTLSDVQLQGMTVAKLRAVARAVCSGSMTRKEIRFAKKEELIAAIEQVRGQEG